MAKKQDDRRRYPRAKRLTQLPKGSRRLEIRRQEFNRLIDLLNARGEVVNDILRNQDIQFQRIAQMQAEIDLIKRKLERERRSDADQA